MSNRRTFLSRSAAVAVLGGSAPWWLAASADAQPLPALAGSADPDNVLLVIALSGGNDGLNTIVPYADDTYHRVRPSIALDPKTVLPIDAAIGFNPVLAALDDLYKDGHVAVVQGVGYPNPNRSHFEATQIWETASPEGVQEYGWLGRYLDAGVPVAQPANDPARLFTAVTLGDTIPAALIGQRVDVPAVGAPGAFGYNSGKDTASKSTAGALYDGAQPGQSPYLALVESTARTALHGSDILRAKIASFQNAVTYPTDPFATQLRLAAQIAGSKLGTRIIFVSLGSFDTHAGQRAQQDRLLGYLGGGLRAFYADLAAHGMSQRVLTMTFSEFGRRVAQNASNGTDHGTAMPMFVVGGAVKGGKYGADPALDDLVDGDLRFGIDFRAVYATILQRWLGRDPRTIIAGDFANLPFV